MTAARPRPQGPSPDGHAVGGGCSRLILLERVGRRPQCDALADSAKRQARMTVGRFIPQCRASRSRGHNDVTGICCRQVRRSSQREVARNGALLHSTPAMTSGLVLERSTFGVDNGYRLVMIDKRCDQRVATRPGQSVRRAMVAGAQALANCAARCSAWAMMPGAREPGTSKAVYRR